MNFSVAMGPVSMEQSSVTRCTTVLTSVTRPAVSKVGTGAPHTPWGESARAVWPLEREEAYAAPLGRAKLFPVQFYAILAVGLLGRDDCADQADCMT